MWKNKLKDLFIFKNYLAPLLFISFLIITSYIYDYQEIIFKRPQSVHMWRQCDCASITLNYYQGGMHFFQPEVHNLTSDNGTTGKCCTSEIPILYYSIAFLYKIFGYHEFIYRIINTLLFFLGLFYLFKLIIYLTKDIYWSISLTLLVFTSPVLVYYGCNFLTNSSAFAFALIAWYHFIRFLFEKKYNYLYLSLLFFFLAGAFKVTALFSLIAITCIFILELFFHKRFNENEKLFKKPGH